VSYVIQNFIKTNLFKKIHFKYIVFIFKKNYKLIVILNFIKLVNSAKLFYINFLNNFINKSLSALILGYLIFFKKSKKVGNKLNSSLVFNLLSDAGSQWAIKPVNTRVLQVINKKIFFLNRRNYSFQLIMLFFRFLCVNHLTSLNFDLARNINLFANYFTNVKFYNTLFLRFNIF